MSFRILILIILLTRSGTNGTTFQWNTDGNWQRSLQPGDAVCVDIPANMSLCHGIGYSKMRLPNLLHHDSLTEVSQQAISWIPLFQLNCHPDTQIFLCSLFTPVCLEHPIPPCRSLCRTVQSSCEDTMSKYGYPWPHIVRCDQFPVDNDMCIMAQHDAGGVLGLPPNNGSSSTELVPKVELYPDGTPKGVQPKNDQTEKKKKRKKKKKVTKLVTTSTEASTSQGHDLSTPVLGHHHHLQTFTEAEVIAKNNEDHQEVNPTTPAVILDQPEKSSTIQSGLLDDVQEHILTTYCHSQWSGKVRAAVKTDPRGSLVLDVKSFRLLWRSVTMSDKNVQPSKITIPMEVSRDVASIVSAGSGVTDQSTNARETVRRFFVMGRSKGEEFEANLVLAWPHKSTAFRRALKLIKNGSVECSVTTTTTTPVPVHHERKNHSSSTKDQRHKRRQRTRNHQRHHSSPSANDS